METSLKSYPPWLKDKFLKKVLNNKDLTVKNVTRLADEEEDKALCDTYKVAVELPNGILKEINHLIIKSAEQTTQAGSEKSLIREISAYTQVISRMQEMLDKICIQFAPKLYYTSCVPEVVLVLEDLEGAGFRHAVPSPGFDWFPCLLVVRKLAFYHASSAVLHKTQPGFVDSFKVSAYSDAYRDRLEKIYPPFLKKLAIEVESWPDYKERFAEKLHNLANSAVDEICGCARTRESDFNVLCHEELSVKNIVFGYSEDASEIDETRFLDYSCVHWGSPAVDFYRFLHSCAAPDVLEWSQVLVEEYIHVLQHALRLLGHIDLCPPISHLYQEFQRRVTFGLILGLVDRAFFLSDKDFMTFSDINSLLETKFSERFKTVAKKLLVIFQIKGWL